MGITGLLPFLEKGKVSRPVNIKEFSGCTVAADAYCWLHKGAFSCADKLARGEETDMYVQYCMKFVNMLLSHNIKPILVFDGRHLPAKAATEKKRREKREENRKQAASLLRQGHTTEALSFLRRCIDVTHKMALRVMIECRKRNVDCIVAPYEADAQLAFFSLEHIADLIITEDSDLLLFGCKKVLFKLDLAGNGVLVDQSRLHQAMGARPEMYSFDKFRYMCILSGCDYLESLPGIGLGKACKFVCRTLDPDIHKALSRLPSQLNIRGLSVPMVYRDDFMKADAMFRHQLIFDPMSRKTRPLTPFKGAHPASPLAAGPLPGCEPEFDDETCYQLALGNLDPFNLEKVDDYDPDSKSTSHHIKTSGWSQVAIAPHPSIWDSQYRDIAANKHKSRPTPSFMISESRPSTKGKSQTIDTSYLLNKTVKREAHTDEIDKQVTKKPCRNESNLADLYAENPTTCTSSVASPHKPISEASSDLSPTSPIFSGKRFKRNPFAKTSTSESVLERSCVVEAVNDYTLKSPSSLSKASSTPGGGKFGALSKFAEAIHRTSTEGKPVVKSRYFTSCQETSPKLESDFGERNSSLLLRDLSNTSFNGDSIKERLISMGYEQESPYSTKLAMIHKKPLFAFNPKVSGSKHSELQSPQTGVLSEASCDVLTSALHGNACNKQSDRSNLTSPSKNPFRKKALLSTESEEIENSAIEPSSCQVLRGKAIYHTADDEAVDDPEFDSSPGLNSSSMQIPCSQPDEGFESPSKADIFLTPPFVLDKQPEPLSTTKQTCRISGLRKTTSPGQSKLSSFGFCAKPKVPRA